MAAASARSNAVTHVTLSFVGLVLLSFIALKTSGSYDIFYLIIYVTLTILAEHWIYLYSDGT